MRNKKYLFSTLCVATVCSLITIITSNATNVYANQLDAPVAITTDAPVQDVVTGGSQRKAPVSIAVYSNVVTESADTYDYSNKIQTGSQPSALPEVQVQTPGTDASQVTPIPSNIPVELLTVVTTTTPAPETVTAPQGTGSPEATPEPDMLTYPPTVAPAYTD